MPGSAASFASRVTRRELLRAGGAVGLAALAAAAAGDQLRGGEPVLRVNRVRSRVAPSDPRYATRPDLRIPGLAVATSRAGLAQGLIFIAPYNAPTGQQAGAVIVDDTGEPVWEHPLAGLVTTNFQVQRYGGRPALTWWDGVVRNGHGIGVYTIAGEDYRPLRSVQAGNGLRADLHEFVLTPRGTALLTAYLILPHDLSSVGGPSSGTIQDAIVQELDLASGRVLFEWHSLDHIPLSESYWPVGPLAWDYVHINSIDVDTDDNLLISSRNTHTVYKVDRRSGEVIWRLGGKSSQFAVARDAVFAWQHDVRRQTDGTMSVFDNEGPPHGGPESRAIVLAVDERARTASLVSEYRHPSALLATSQGSVQILANGNVFVGWGAEPYVSEFSPSGELLFDAQLGTDYLSYRAYRLPWTGTGAHRPAIAAERTVRQIDVFASWNGDTRTAFWVLLSAGRRGPLEPASALPREGFETVLRAHARARRIAVRALDVGGAVLGQSATIEV
jgi:outer membrane protein assembly factor BamB